MLLEVSAVTPKIYFFLFELFNYEFLFVILSSLVAAITTGFAVMTIHKLSRTPSYLVKTESGRTLATVSSDDLKDEKKIRELVDAAEHPTPPHAPSPG
jgi:hypothetical protein